MAKQRLRRGGVPKLPPSQAEIRRRAAEIQSGWTDEQRAVRAGLARTVLEARQANKWIPPVVDVLPMGIVFLEEGAPD